MKNAFKWLLIGGALLAMLAMWSGFALWHGLHEFVMQPDVSFSINGEDIDIEGLREWGSAPWYEVMFGMMMAGLALCLVLPLVLVFSIGLPILLTVLILGGVAFGLLSLGGLLFSPFILLALLLWLVFRNKRRPSQTTAASRG
ncbi:hypothetical protein [Paucibacter sp. Y2R2-4]|uniref:hypothetical protein n=1 Tax=Paucibacter sp. Y2R2-4 TaxID=2893553 RepID=UPI0021E4A49A|nr:hypothetical protein [Paucibacter sp. Y2R2-4]MCV2350934.1 hypothetical protein [Paucibacter sp. Y2R2-4]